MPFVHTPVANKASLHPKQALLFKSKKSFFIASVVIMNWQRRRSSVPLDNTKQVFHYEL